MTQPRTESPVQYRDCWIVAGWSGHNRVDLRILVETDGEARAIASRLHPNMWIGQCYCDGRVIDPERNRDILED